MEHNQTPLHFLGEVGQKAIIEKDNKILLYRGAHRSIWDLPGGRLNKDEDPETGLKREIFEELGVGIIINKPFFVCAAHHINNQPPRYFVVFTAVLDDASAPFTLAQDEIAEVRFVGVDELDQFPTHGAWRDAIERYFRQR